MAWSEQQLRDAFHRALEPAEDYSNCPDPDSIWGAVGMLLPGPQRVEIIQHMAGCANCAFVWQAATAVREQPSQTRTVSRPASGRRHWWQDLLRPIVLAPLAGAVAALFVAVIWIAPEGLPDMPSPAGSGVMRGLPETADPLTQDAPPAMAPGSELSWAPVAGATAHKLTLFDDGGQTIELFPEPSNRYRLAPQLGETFAFDERVYWYVEAIDGDRPGARSVTASFIFTDVNADG